MNAFTQIITNSALLSLAAGFIIGVWNVFHISKPMSTFVSLYLVFCIGLKGGMSLGAADAYTPALLMLCLAGLIIGFLQPFACFPLVKKVTDLDHDTAVVVACQYGSISIVTFVTALSFLQQRGIAYDPFMVAVAGLMEIPAIISGLFLLQSGNAQKGDFFTSGWRMIKDMLLSPKINFIFIGFLFGFLLRHHHGHVVPITILWPFYTMLIIFMIDVGIKIAHQRAYINQFTKSLIAFGIYIPIISGCSSVLVSYLLGIQPGSALLFAVLIGSASYIAVPAVMGAQAPKAKQVIYLPLSLAVTLPFNIIIGIPLFYALANYLCG